MAVERIEGVRQAEFAYPEGTGVVTFDTTVTADSVIIAGLTRATGFEAVAVHATRDGAG